MTTNKANAEWNGTLKDGKGAFKLGESGFQGQYSFKSRFEGEQGNNPEELIAAAHAACFSMALSHKLAEAGFPPKAVKTEARVTLDKVEGGFGITKIVLSCNGDVPGISDTQFQQLAGEAKIGCPVSKALAAVPSIALEASLQKAAA